METTGSDTDSMHVNQNNIKFLNFANSCTIIKDNKQQVKCLLEIVSIRAISHEINIYLYLSYDTKDLLGISK